VSTKNRDFKYLVDHVYSPMGLVWGMVESGEHVNTHILYFLLDMNKEQDRK